MGNPAAPTTSYVGKSNKKPIKLSAKSSKAKIKTAAKTAKKKATRK